MCYTVLHRAAFEIQRQLPVCIAESPGSLVRVPTLRPGRVREPPLVQHQAAGRQP